MTCAFWSAAQTMPFATHSLVPLPLSPRTLPFKMTASWPAPATPVPLFVEAAAVPATWVPWLQKSSAPLGDVVKFNSSTTLLRTSIWPKPSGPRKVDELE